MWIRPVPLKAVPESILAHHGGAFLPTALQGAVTCIVSLVSAPPVSSTTYSGAPLGSLHSRAGLGSEINPLGFVEMTL